MKNEHIKELITVATQAFIDGKVFGFEIGQNSFKFDAIINGDYSTPTYSNMNDQIDEIINDINNLEDD